MRSWPLALLLIATPAFAQDYGSGMAMVYQRPPVVSSVTADWEVDFEEAVGCGDSSSGDTFAVLSGSPDCDDTTSPMEGSQHAFLDGKATSSSQFLWITPAFTNVTTGTYWIDFLWKVSDQDATNSAFQELVTSVMDFGNNAKLQFRASNSTMRVVCDDGTTGDSSTSIYSTGTVYNVRKEVALAGDEVTLYLDTGSTWGGTSIASCNGAGSNPGIDDIRLVSVLDHSDLYFDAVGFCTTDPGSSKCGD